MLAVPVGLVTLLCVLTGPGFQLHVSIAHLIGTTIGVLLLGVDFGVLALLLGALTGSRGLALGIASAVAAATYLISSLAPVTHWIRPLRVVSPFYYAVGDGQLADGIGVGAVLVLVVIALVLLGAALVAFERLDIR